MTNNLLTLLLQLPVDTLNAVNAVNADVAVEVPEELNIWSLMLKGGFFMIPLLLLSVLSIYIFVERLLVVRKAGKEDKTFMDRIKDYIHDGEIDAALKLCKKTDTPAARLIAKGISRLGRPMNDVLVAIENTGNIEIAQLEKGFPWLATTAAGAPMIGFLGTVTGMVNAFYNMASAGNNADITTLSSGIYEALVTTIAGLVVGVIALFAYNYLVARVDGVMNQLETKTMEFMDLLNEPAE
ncbi:MAG: MotA/TolQ/ExbB proton channel family protein [Bacteroidaceae bacterium]|nr:MotA/TolQ/ExbB proton channel family protein [Bacteroidaceae bacterium]MBR4070711.1 MotA/TolQ/ExbB proton channel family protein [Bacteroidaceae bacterium]